MPLIALVITRAPFRRCRMLLYRRAIPAAVMAITDLRFSAYAPPCRITRRPIQPPVRDIEQTSTHFLAWHRREECHGFIADGQSAWNLLRHMPPPHCRRRVP